MSSAADFSFYRLSVASLMSCAGKHRVLCGDPALPFSNFPTRNSSCKAGRTQNARQSKMNKHRTFRVLAPRAFDFYFAKFVIASSTLSGQLLSLSAAVLVAFFACFVHVASSSSQPERLRGQENVSLVPQILWHRQLPENATSAVRLRCVLDRVRRVCDKHPWRFLLQS